jgi:autotransporter-associated beta strand protein
LKLTGNNTFTGATVISASGGTLEAAANGALGSGTTGTSGITVNSGGTLLLSNSAATDRVKNTAPVSLAGGTVSIQGTGTGGTSVKEGTGAHSVGAVVQSGASSVGLGALTLTASNSTLDFGTGGVGTLTFGSFDEVASGALVLNILNYSTVADAGTQTSGTDGVDDRLIFNESQSGNLANFSFGGLSASQIDLGDGFYELTPVPEPSTWGAAGLALVAMACTQRKRFRRALKRA